MVCVSLLCEGVATMTPEEFWSILHDVPKSKPIFYRLYYDTDGVPLFYSMEDLPGTYIEIDQDTYTSSPTNVQVKNGQLIALTWHVAHKLTLSDSGTQCHSQDVSIVTADQGQHWKKKTYESN
jgi:hypothetical protein